MILSILFLLFFAVKVHAWDANNPESVKEYAIYVAQNEGVDVSTMYAIAMCESGFRTGALHVSPKEYSVGIFQINLKAHPYISEAEALNPFFNINWSIEQMRKGLWRMWSCFA